MLFSSGPPSSALSARSRALEWHTRAKLTLNRFKQHTPERELAMLVTQGNAAVAGAYEYLCSRHAKENGLDQVGDISRLFVYYVGRLCDAAE